MKIEIKLDILWGLWESRGQERRLSKPRRGVGFYF
jgi:hypothetical protein